MSYIWRMWLSKNPLPPWVRLCLDSTVKHNLHEYKLVTDDTLHLCLPDLRKEVWEITHIVAISEYIRFALIARYGGIWLDADSIVMHSLRFILDEIERGKLFLLREQLRTEEFYDPGFFGAPPNHPTIVRALSLFDQLLTEGHRDFPWVIGGELLNQAIREIPASKFVLHSSLTHPFTCVEQDKLLQTDISISDVVNPNAPVLVFAAEMFRRYNYGDLQNQTAEQILSSDTVIGQLFRRSQNNSLLPNVTD